MMQNSIGAPASNYDVVIAGGGIAGSSVAAALADFGYRILIVEPGLDHAKRLAGELIHPSGVDHLSELGLLKPLLAAGGIRIRGFALFTGSGANKPAHVLPYSDSCDAGSGGFAIEHGVMVRALLDHVATLSNVKVQCDSRVTGIDSNSPDAVTVTIEHTRGRDRVTAPLLVAADGRSSHVRTMVGIPHQQTHISNMIGYMLPGAELPQPNFGHVFIGGSSPVLAYSVSRSETRIMFDRPPDSNDDCLHALPPAVKERSVRAIETQAPLRSVNVSITPETVFKGRTVCVGDAGGCCHPLTATGLSACTRDAVLLRQALRETGHDIPKAMQHYARRRAGPQRTRMAGADLLYAAFRAQTPEMRLLRQGLFRYWDRSPAGRITTMALLSMQEERLASLVREYAQICRHSVPELMHMETRGRAAFGLSRELVRFVGHACVDSLMMAAK